MSTFVILAAGNSTRFGSDKLREPIGGATLPQRAAIFAVANGATRICVTLNRNSVETDGHNVFHPVLRDIKEYVADDRVEVAFQDQGSYGAGAAIQAWEGRIGEDFTVLFGDNLIIGELPTFDPDTTYFSTRNLQKDPRNLQLAAVQDGLIVEKPHAFSSGDFFCGFAHFPRGFFASLPNLQKSNRGEYEITDMINFGSTVQSIDLDAHGLTWGDITFKADISQVEALL